MNYKITDPISIGQQAEEFTRILNTSISNLQAHMPLLLTTTQRLGLDISLKNPNRLVFDTNENRWYRWTLVSGVYNWKPERFIENAFSSSVAHRQGTIILQENGSMVSYSHILDNYEYNPASETMLVIVDGTVLTEGVHFTVNTVNKTLSTTGVWYKGQQMSVIVIYSEQGTENLALSDILQRLKDLEDNGSITIIRKWD